MNLIWLRRKIQLITRKYLDYVIFYNYKYRAKGCFPAVKDYLHAYSGDDKIYYEVYPETISETEIPEELIRISSSYIKYQLKAKETAKYILKVNRGRLLTDCIWTIGVFDEHDKLIGDLSLDLLLPANHSIKESRMHKRKNFPEVQYFKGTVFYTIAGGGAYENYGHWLIDSFSRLHILKESGLFDQVDWFYVPSIQYDYQLDSLNAFGIPREKIIESEKYPHIKADVLLASSYTRGPHIPQWTVDFFHREFPPKSIPVVTSKKYFISRKDSAVRTIVNEEDVSQLLAKYGIETIVLSKLSFQEKIDLFAYADLIVSLSGAGLTNFLFCKEGTTVLEIFGDQFVDFSFFYDIAIKRKLDYHFLIANNGKKADNVLDGQESDVFIALDALRDMLNDELGLSLKDKEQQIKS